MKRIGCFGGSFNPIHTGHLEIAKQAIKQCGLQEVWFIPSLSTPLKEKQSASFAHRAEMIGLMIKPYRKMKICTIEAQLSTPSYTINTVDFLHEHFPDVTFLWIMGSDQANQFDKWKDNKRLLEEIEFIVYPRNDADNIPLGMKKLEMAAILPNSSTRVREGIVTDTSPVVVRYMIENQLYLESIAKSKVSPKRWLHVKSMCDLACRIAQSNHTDIEKVRLAALFHDCAKSMKEDELKAWLGFCYPVYIEQHPSLWHQIVGAEIAKREFQIRDPEVLAAIRHHVNGTHRSMTAMIVYLADKLDESRGYDSSAEIALAMKDVRKAYENVRTSQREYLLKEGVDVQSIE